MGAGRNDKTVAEIRTRNGAVILIDAADVERVADFTWTARRGVHGHTYAVTRWKTKTILMHRLILDVPPGKVVDHVNNNGLDNRRENLRVCTYAENLRNRKVHKNNGSGLKGVFYRRGAWRARITVNGQRTELGSFPTRELAHAAYCAEAERLHGSFANPGNRPPVDIRSVSERKRAAACRPVVAVNDLSRTQREVLELLASGMMPIEIATHMGTSPNTVATHLARIKERLGAKSTIHAAVMWARAKDAANAEYDSWAAK